MISIGKTNQIEEPVKYHTVYSVNSIPLRIITSGYLKFKIAFNKTNFENKYTWK